MPGDSYGMPLGLCLYYWILGEIDQAADWAVKAMEQRSPPISFLASIFFRSSLRWPALARLMSLPEEAR